MKSLLMSKDLSRAVISAVIVVLFGFAYLDNPDDEMMKGALIAAFTTVVTWWLGSSKGSSDKTEELLGRQQVEVVNSPDRPVPVAEDTGDTPPMFRKEA